jgi:hypothetical protein
LTFRLAGTGSRKTVHNRIEQIELKMQVTQMLDHGAGRAVMGVTEMLRKSAVDRRTLISMPLPPVVGVGPENTIFPSTLDS